MIYLVIKDLLLQKRMLYMMLLYVVLFSFTFQSMLGGQLIATIVAVSYMFVMMGCAWEEKNNGDILWNSLPVPRWKIVGAKYVSVVVYVLMVVPVYLVVSMVFSLLKIPVTMVPVTGWALLTALLTVFFMSSIYLPVFFGLGYTKSRYWNFLLFAGIVALGTIIPTVLPEPPLWLDIDSLAAQSATTLLILSSIVVLLMVISYAISLVVYGRREF